MKFDVRYYLVAILFILFDLEIAFLFPWAVCSTRSDCSVSGDDRVPGDPRGRLHLRMEEGCAGMGMRQWCRGQPQGDPVLKDGVRMGIEGGFVTTRSIRSSTGRAPAPCGR
jgi:hypothetical protein